MAATIRAVMSASFIRNEVWTLPTTQSSCSSNSSS